MYDGFGAFGWPAIALVALIAAVIAVAYFRFGLLRRGRGRGRAKTAFNNERRLEVLDTTVIDHERSLVLVRCDRIEHLILIGGPTDVVVENDVRRVRGPASAPAKPATISEMTQRPPARAVESTAAPEPDGQAAAPLDPVRGERRAASDGGRSPPQQRPGSAPLPAPIVPVVANGGGSRPAEPGGEAAPRAPGARSAPQEQQSAKRDSVAPRRATHITPAPLTASRPGEAPARSIAERESERQARAGNGRQAAAPGKLPPAESPWPESDSVEREIVQALHLERKQGPAPAPTSRQDPSGKTVRDPSTTLGDLADRLEEALAREVQAVNQKQPDLDFDFESFAFEHEEAPKETERKASAQNERTEPRARPETRDRPEQTERKERAEPARSAMPAAPTPDSRTEPARPSDRREEAPVISLNSRRREPVDPLEDEMARLLGELSGDSKGR